MGHIRVNNYGPLMSDAVHLIFSFLCKAKFKIAIKVGLLSISSRTNFIVDLHLPKKQLNIL